MVATDATWAISGLATAGVIAPPMRWPEWIWAAGGASLLLACALVANAESFVLPISNPANLVLYGGLMPPLGAWLSSFALTSLGAIMITFAMLALVKRKQLGGVCASHVVSDPLSRGGWAALAGIVLTGLCCSPSRRWTNRLGCPRRWPEWP